MFSELASILENCHKTVPSSMLCLLSTQIGDGWGIFG